MPVLPHRSLAQSVPWRILPWVAGFWLLETLYSIFQLHYRMGLSPRKMSWAECVRGEGAWTLIGILFTPLALWLASRFNFERGRWVRDLLAHIAGAAVFAIGIRIVWDYLGIWREASWLKEFSWQALAYSLSMGFEGGFVVYCLLVMGVISLGYYRRYQSSLLAATQLQTELVQAQLQNLRMQLNPHFLFNTLNSISELVHQDPESADRMISRLSSLLRRSIAGSEHQESPLDEELEFLQQYLEIEQVRFEDRLTVEYNVTNEANRAMVPTLILQPLVENSIRHGIACRVREGRIEIHARREDDQLVLSVRDNGNSLPPDAIREGVGLRSVRGRLERLYGDDRQSLELNTGQDGFEVILRFPFRQAVEPALPAEPKEVHATR